MFLYDSDGQMHGSFDSKEEAFDHMVDAFNIVVDDDALTPEHLSVETNDHIPFSAVPHDEQVTWLRDSGHLHPPIEKIAKDAIEAEREHMAREEHTPADASPLDTDRHTVALEEWLDRHANYSAFQAHGCSEAYDEYVDDLHDRLNDTVSEMWSDGYAEDWELHNGELKPPEEVPDTDGGFGELFE